MASCRPSHLAGGRVGIRAVRVHQFGRPPRVDPVPAPGPPGPGEVVIDVAAAGVGAWDAGVAEGRLAALVGDAPPLTLGAQMAGRVRAVGAGVEGFAVGDRVMANPGIVGAWAETVRVRASACGRSPSGLDDAQAAALPVRALTAWQALGLLDLPAGSTLLVCGAGGAVGRTAIEMAAGRGQRVLALAGAGGPARLLRLGAVEVADHRRDWRGRLADAAPGGVDAVLDLVGGDSLRTALGLLRPGGRAVTTISEAASSPAPPGVALEFLAMRSSTEDLDAIAGLVERGGLTANVAGRYPLEQAAAALDAVRSPVPPDGDIVLDM